MHRHRSNQRPSRRAVAAAAAAVTENLEGRRLLSGGAGSLPLSALPYLYMGPAFDFSHGAATHAGRSAKPQAAPTARAAKASRAPAAPAGATASVPPPAAAAQTEADRPSITGSYPANGASAIAPDAFVAADLLFPVAGAVIDPSTLNSNNVRLIRTRDNTIVAGVPKTDGAAGVIVLKPADLLDPNTTYRFEVTTGLRDTFGNAFQPFSSTFTTGAIAAFTDPNIAFEKVSLPTTQGNKYTGVTFGPDGKLYASTALGAIHRFSVNPDGTLSTPQVINTVLTANHTDKRLVTGLKFDPASTAGNLVLWVTHSQYSNTVGEDWQGRVSRLSGANLEAYQDYVISLPRSVRDHLTNQIDFGPDGALYIGQGSNNALGAPDAIWGGRPERVLAGAVLRLDTAAVAARIAAGQGPLDARTDEGGTYDPFAAGAPLTLYATGLRNVYDLVWHSNGQLYAPANGSAAGGNSPGFDGTTPAPRRIDQGTAGAYPGTIVPALTNVRTTEDDYLFRISQGGYYGHPNPTRGEYVLHGGNPTPGVDPDEWTQYPVGTQPDRNFRGSDADRYDFGRNYSPDGVIEYKGAAFGGALDKRLMVARFSGGDDIVIIDVGADGGVTRVQRGLAGLSNLDSPLDLVEGPTTGFLYVSEYGGQRLTLLRPVAAGGNVSIGGADQMYFNEPVGGNVGEGSNRTFTITNNGTSPLAIPADGLRIEGPDAGLFRFASKPILPTTIPAGQSVQVTVSFGVPSGAALGVKTATLNVKTNDADQQTVPLALRGLATAGVGGTSEPSLQRVLDLYQIPVNTGDADPATADLFSATAPLHTPNDELAVQTLVKANAANPVTVQPLAVFGSNKTKVATRFGWYDAGSKQARSELFSVDQLEAQSVSPTPIGTTSFDPGSKGFGLFSIWPPFTNREIYSEDVFNTGEGNPALRHHVHFYPMKNPDGSAVPDAMVVSFEEFFNDPNSASDAQDLVVVLRNVRAAAAGPELGLENLDNGPYYDRLAFNRIQNPTTALGTAAFHDLSTVRLWNTGTQSLRVSALTVTGNYRVEPAVAVPFDIPVGGTRDVQVRFVGTQSGGAVQNGGLRVTTNDADEPNVDVQLSGSWQSVPENGQEPTLEQVMQILDYRTTLANPGQLLSHGGRLEAVGEEVLSPYWVRTDTSKPVTVRQVASYHTQNVSHSVKWFAKGTETLSPIVVNNFVSDAQALLPRNGAGTGPAIGTFDGSPTTPFGFKIGDEWSDPTKNAKPSNQPDDQGHHVRFFPLRVRVPGSPDQTRVVRDTWLMVMDFSGINYDYNDNVYVISNARPAPPPAPAGVAATVQPSGGFQLAWQRNADPLTRTYNVYRSLGPGGGFEKVNGAPVSDAQFLDTTAPPGATYYYKVTALDDWGGESNRNTVTPIRADYTPPPPATGLIATPQPDGIVLDWTASAGADDLAGYRILRSGSPNGPFTPLGGVVADTIYNDTTASGGFIWYYNVVAVDVNGNASDPITASAVRPGGDPGAVLAGAPDVSSGGTSYTFVVTYSENAVMAADALAGSVVVTGPGGFSQAAAVAAVDGHNVTYAVTPPGGSWNAADSGAYAIAVQPNKVGDGAGKFVPAGNLGTFQANIAPAYDGETTSNAIDLAIPGPKGKKAVRDTLTPGSKTDLFYKVTLGQVSRLRSKLGKLREDVAFDLRDANGTTLATSDKPKRKPESLLRALPAGTYYLYLTLKGAAPTGFVMNTVVGKPTKKDLKSLGGS